MRRSLVRQSFRDARARSGRANLINEGVIDPSLLMVMELATQPALSNFQPGCCHDKDKVGARI